MMVSSILLRTRLFDTIIRRTSPTSSSSSSFGWAATTTAVVMIGTSAGALAIVANNNNIAADCETQRSEDDGSSSSQSSSNTDAYIGGRKVTKENAKLMAASLVHRDTRTLHIGKVPPGWTGTTNTAGGERGVETTINEPATGIPFPRILGNKELLGLGVRVKYWVANVYGVGTYMDPELVRSLRQSSSPLEIQEALLDPTSHPRVVRIVLNFQLTESQFITAIVQALEPRMAGQDLWALDDLKQTPVGTTLPKGFEYIMDIRDDTLLMYFPGQGYSTIKSKALCRALCDVYFGNDPISPTHKDAVVNGLSKKEEEMK